MFRVPEEPREIQALMVWTVPMEPMVPTVFPDRMERREIPVPRDQLDPREILDLPVLMDSLELMDPRDPRDLGERLDPRVLLVPRDLRVSNTH